jgi:1,4-alpha-glucan branching enzyme
MLEFNDALEYFLQEKYVFKHPQPKKPKSLRIYESHVGMSSTVCIFPFYLRCNILLFNYSIAISV